MGIEVQKEGQREKTGYLTQGGTDISTDFEPVCVSFWTILHQGSFNSEYYSGTSNGAANAWASGWGFAIGPNATDQYVSSFASSSESANGHYTYAGDSEVVYIIQTSNAGVDVYGRARAEISTWDETGITLNWTATGTDGVFVFYRVIG
jgi:hypothetical protein